MQTHRLPNPDLSKEQQGVGGPTSFSPSFCLHHCRDSTALQLFISSLSPVLSSICSINCLSAQLVSGSRPVNSAEQQGCKQRSRRPNGTTLPALMVIMADRSGRLREGEEERGREGGQHERGGSINNKQFRINNNDHRFPQCFVSVSFKECFWKMGFGKCQD